MKKTLCLIDGSGYVYRAFYAIPPMNRKKDMLPTNAVYGFTSMLMNFVKKNHPDYIVVVFDAARRNFRNEIYSEYKANRRETPEELKPQFPIIRQAVASFNMKAVEKEGFEADDIIATYATEGVAKGFKVQVVSADKDLMQLMSDDVEIYDPMKEKLLGQEDVLKKFFVSPDKVVDVQALAGDTSDNVPGVSGIGPKTAGELINTFGSLEGLYENLETLPPSKKKERLTADKENAFISKKLVTLARNVPDLPKIDDLVLVCPEVSKLTAFLEENGFKSLLSRVKDVCQNAEIGIDNSVKEETPAPVMEKTVSVPAKYTLIQDKGTLQKWLSDVRDNLSLAVLKEESGAVVGFSLAKDLGQACYVPLSHEKREQTFQMDLFGGETVIKKEKQVALSELKELLIPLLAKEDCLKIAHGMKEVLHAFYGLFGKESKIEPIADTQVMAYDSEAASKLSLEELSDRLLDIRLIPKEEVCGRGKTALPFRMTDVKEVMDYACQRSEMPLYLYSVLLSTLKEQGTFSVYEKTDLPLVDVLCKMEREGVLVNKERLSELTVVFREKMTGLEKEIFEEAGEVFNINSPAQLGHILFDKMGLEGGKKSSVSHQWVTDSEVLETLSEKGCLLPTKVLEYRQYAKLVSTYTEALVHQTDATGRVHTTFSQTMTSTGRLSSNNPNLQNIPIRTEAGRLIRSAFIAPKGCVLMSSDYSQIELRLIADVAGVKGLKEAFEQGIDIHSATASQVFGVPVEGMDPMIRRHAKAINFGIIYGISAFGLAKQLGISNSEAKGYIDAYFARYPEIKTYMDETVMFAKEHGYVLTPFGRRCYVPSFENGATRGFASRAAINAPIQGGAADMIKMAMIKMPKALADAGLSAKMLLQVHDELVFEVPESEINATQNLIKNVMENVVSLSVPLVAEVGFGADWTEAH